MKKLLLTLLAVPGIACASHLTTYADADFFGGGSGNPPTGVLLTTGGSVTSSFDFTAADGTSTFTITNPPYLFGAGTYSSQLGFVPGVNLVDPGSTSFTFFFRDPQGGQESFSIMMGDIARSDSNFGTYFVTSFGGTALIEGTINASGMISYTVSSTSGEFFFDAAYARLDATRQNVPDGGATVALLGMAFVGVAAIRRKLTLG